MAAASGTAAPLASPSSFFLRLLRRWSASHAPPTEQLDAARARPSEGLRARLPALLRGITAANGFRMGNGAAGKAAAALVQGASALAEYLHPITPLPAVPAQAAAYEVAMAVGMRAARLAVSQSASKYLSRVGCPESLPLVLQRLLLEPDAALPLSLRQLMRQASLQHVGLLRAGSDRLGSGGGGCVDNCEQAGWWEVVEAWIGMSGGQSAARISAAVARARRGLRAADGAAVAKGSSSVLQEIV